MHDQGVFWITLIITALAYFAPSLVAYERRHNNLAAIIATNIFLGWTAIGWVIAIIWAFTDNRRGKA